MASGLTLAGQRFAEAETDERKKLFGDHLLAYVPLAAHIKVVLDDRPTHRAKGVRFSKNSKIICRKIMPTAL